MNKYKDYFYYKGEHLNPYKEGSKESYFWNAECRHSDISQNNPQFIKTICDIFNEITQMFTRAVNIPWNGRLYACL